MTRKFQIEIIEGEHAATVRRNAYKFLLKKYRREVLRNQLLPDAGKQGDFGFAQSGNTNT